MTEKCSKCGSVSDEYFSIDGAIICKSCMYGDSEPVKVYPIGVVKNGQKRSKLPFGVKNKSGVSEIILLESQRPFLYKLEDEQYITVIFHLHKSRPVKSVFRRGLDGKKVGVFASRTPDRLSGLAISDVKLLRVEGTSLFVEGLDAVDGTPVLDIKLGLKGK